MTISTKSSGIIRVVAIWVLISALALSVINVAYAATIIVTTTDDELNSDGDCSLREAVQAANTNSIVDECLAGSGYLDTPTFFAKTSQKQCFTPNKLVSTPKTTCLNPHLAGMER